MKLRIASLLAVIILTWAQMGVDSPLGQLKDLYHEMREKSSDMRENLPILRTLSSRSTTVMELGVRNMVGTWAILLGLAENSNISKKIYIGVDLTYPNPAIMVKASMLAENTGTLFFFLASNDMELINFKSVIRGVDLMFVDSLHTYCHVRYTLESYAPLVQKYIILHDTNGPWSYIDQDNYSGNYSEYPLGYNCTNTKGVLPAVKDFLRRNKNWIVKRHSHRSNGATLLIRAGIPGESSSEISEKFGRFKTLLFSKNQEDGSIPL